MGDFQGSVDITPPGEPGHSLRLHFSAKMEACDPCMMLDVVAVSSSVRESTRGIVGFDRVSGCYRAFLWCLLVKEPIDLRGTFRHGGLWLEGGPVTTKWGLQHLRYSLVSTPEDGLRWRVQFWSPDRWRTIVDAKMGRTNVV